MLPMSDVSLDLSRAPLGPALAAAVLLAACSGPGWSQPSREEPRARAQVYQAEPGSGEAATTADPGAMLRPTGSADPRGSVAARPAIQRAGPRCTFSEVKGAISTEGLELEGAIGGVALYSERKGLLCSEPAGLSGDCQIVPGKRVVVVRTGRPPVEVSALRGPAYLVYGPGRLECTGGPLPARDEARSAPAFVGSWAASPGRCPAFPWVFTPTSLSAPGDVSCEYSAQATDAPVARLEAVCRWEGGSAPVSIYLRRLEPDRMTIDGQPWHERVTLVRCPG